MTIISSSSFSVADQVPETASATVIIGPPIGASTGTGRLTHPVLGSYDYINTPNETIGVDGNICFGPLYAHAMTASGGVDAQWPGFARDTRVVERWFSPDTGLTIAHLRLIYAMFANPPADPVANPVLWEPNYANGHVYKVAIVDVRAGGEGYKVDWFLASRGAGYAPNPVELELRILEVVS